MQQLVTLSAMQEQVFLADDYAPFWPLPPFYNRILSEVLFSLHIWSLHGQSCRWYFNDIASIATLEVDRVD